MPHQNYMYIDDLWATPSEVATGLWMYGCMQFGTCIASIAGRDPFPLTCTSYADRCMTIPLPPSFSFPASVAVCGCVGGCGCDPMGVGHLHPLFTLPLGQGIMFCCTDWLDASAQSTRTLSRSLFHLIDACSRGTILLFAIIRSLIYVSSSKRRLPSAFRWHH